MVAEGEAQRYFDHAVTLREEPILFLRANKELVSDPEFLGVGQGVGPAAL